MKRAVAAGCLLLLLLLESGQPRQAAAMSKFCRCYQQCYTDCRKTDGPYPCNFGCLQDCINGMPPPPARSSSAPLTAADCGAICVTSICGVMETADAMAGGGAEAACVAHCTKNIGGAFAARADKITN
ncbi:hypothetical protein BS78_04G013500 [Paspalum vaginatum]|nr:hypothetical protein BS78_04G013500 [Paspalum vaginatum]